MDKAATTAEQGTSSQLFSSLCKPKYMERLSEIINSRQATVISTTYCPYCTKAKKTLDANKIKYQEIMLDEIYGEDQLEVANCIYGEERRFVPYLYLN